jgi:undecaprenyl diphosphate synthase
MDENKPRHIAIIPDGNRRWGELHGMSKQEAYAKGIDHIGEVLKWCKEEDIQILTMWGFSTDNFTRDKEEIGGLFELFKSNLKKVIEENRGDARKDEVRVRFIGRTHLFPKEFQEMIRIAEAETAGGAKYQLNLLLAYGGREEIIDAVNAALKSGVKSVDEKSFSELLYTNGIPDPDLIIRTSGEKRLSGLLPWQSTYSEFYFSEKLWPDFSKEEFKAALEDYAKRKRRFGK